MQALSRHAHADSPGLRWPWPTSMAGAGHERNVALVRWAETGQLVRVAVFRDNHGALLTKLERHDEAADMICGV